ncbi:MAG: putative membrane protein YeaQ/YmgE (transglycosylase-associated protein family) [Verrucomicrobiales bacterium]|jgi:uncharacterized membrane protein YeaQ/YmgE (transglycosylase-associated protein family)
MDFIQRIAVLILVGLAAGLIAKLVMKTKMTLPITIVVAILGSLLGSFIAGQIPELAKDIIISTGGAILFLWLARYVTKKK